MAGRNKGTTVKNHLPGGEARTLGWMGRQRELQTPRKSDRASEEAQWGHQAGMVQVGEGDVTCVLPTPPSTSEDRVAI